MNASKSKRGVCPNCGSPDTVPLGRIPVTVAGIDRRRWRYRCAECAAVWTGKRTEWVTPGGR